MDQDEALRLMASVGRSATVAVLVLGLYFLPAEVLTFLAVWTLASFPLGVFIGHCVLRER